MNTYIHAQILNMQAMVQTFERAFEMAAMKDDSKISRDEEKQLKKIKAASQVFLKELDKANTAYLPTFCGKVKVQTQALIMSTTLPPRPRNTNTVSPTWGV